MEPNIPTPIQTPESPLQSISKPSLPREEKSVGPAIGIIVIILIIILGGLYFWGQRLEKQRTLKENLQEQSSSRNQIFVSEV